MLFYYINVNHNLHSQIDQEVKKALGVAFNANTGAINNTDNAINTINDVVNELAEVDSDKNIVSMKDYVEDHKRLQLSKNFNALEQSFSSAKINSKIQNLLNKLLQSVYQEDEIVNSLIAAKQRG